LEDPLKADVLALVEGDVLLKELLVALFLDVDQVRDVDDLRDLGEGLPRPEVVLNHRRRHLNSLKFLQNPPNGRRSNVPLAVKGRGTFDLKFWIFVRLKRSVRVFAAWSYLTSTFAPASVSFFLIVSASALLTPSLTVFGAPSTRSLASLR